MLCVSSLREIREGCHFFDLIWNDPMLISLLIFLVIFPSALLAKSLLSGLVSEVTGAY